MALLETCEKCGKQYMVVYQSKKCPHPRLVDTPEFKKQMEKTKWQNGRLGA